MGSIRTRILTLTALVLLAAGVVGLVALDRLYRANVASVNERLVLASEDQFLALQGAEIAKLYVLLEAVASDPEMHAAFEAGDRTGLQELAWPLFGHLRDDHAIDRWYYYSEEEGSAARVFLRVYEGDEALDPAQYGDEATSPLLDEVRDTGRYGAGFVMGRSRLSLRATAPLLDEAGGIAGYVSFGQGVTDLVDGISRQTGDGYAMFLDKSLLDREAWARSRQESGLDDGWDERVDTVLVASTFDDTSLIDSLGIDAIPDETRILGVVNREGSVYAEGIFPLRDVSGQAVGAVLVLHDITTISESMRATQVALLIAVLALALVGATTVALSLDRMVFRRLDEAVRIAEDLSMAAVSGERLPEVPYRVRAVDDEIGRFEHFLEEYARTVQAALASQRVGESHGTDSEAPRASGASGDGSATV
jgi:hypothetical protein